MISVIVAAYNVEKYIQVCIESILRQTYQDFEIICVNDGSSDSTLAILKSIAQKTDKLKIISQTNSGLSEARNIGIEHSGGGVYSFCRWR